MTGLLQRGLRGDLFRQIRGSRRFARREEQLGVLAIDDLDLSPAGAADDVADAHAGFAQGLTGDLDIDVFAGPVFYIAIDDREAALIEEGLHLGLDGRVDRRLRPARVTFADADAELGKISSGEFLLKR